MISKRTLLKEIYNDIFVLIFLSFSQVPIMYYEKVKDVLKATGGPKTFIQKLVPE